MQNTRKVHLCRDTGITNSMAIIVFSFKLFCDLSVFYPERHIVERGGEGKTVRTDKTVLTRRKNDK